MRVGGAGRKASPISLAEVWVFYMCLRRSLGALVIIADCNAVADGFLEGPEACCRPTRPYSEVWVRVWDTLSDIGRDNISVVWVPSHTRLGGPPKTEVLHGCISERISWQMNSPSGVPSASQRIQKCLQKRPLLWRATRFVAYGRT